MQVIFRKRATKYRAYERVMARMNEPCLTLTMQTVCTVPYPGGSNECVLARMNEAWHISMSHGTHE